MALGRKTGGRQVGSVNKLTSDVREMILVALDRVGGIDYIAAQASANPVAFLTLVGKVLPMQVTGAAGGAVRIEVVTGVPRDDDDDDLRRETL